LNIRIEYEPLEIHHPFHRSNARERCLAGGYGSGKSYALCAEALAFGLDNPGAEILVMRKTIPSLRDTTEAIFVSLIPADLWAQCDIRRAANHYQSIELPNGTKYMFRGLDDWMKLKSMNVAMLAYDELDEIDEETYTGMMSRLRQVRPTPKARKQGVTRITRNCIIASMNPAGHNWCWSRFVGPKAAPGTAWFKSTSLQNPHLPLSYIQSLLDMPEPWVRRYVLCNFDDFGGKIYDDWAWETHVIPPFRYDPAGLFLMGMDPGTRDPTAALWTYYDKEHHRLVGIAEYQEEGLAVTKHAREWRRIEAQHRMKVRQRFADPNAINVRDRGTNMALSDQYRRLGYNFTLGASRIPDRIPALGGLITQGRFVVTTDCPQTHEQITNYRWQDLTPQQRSKGTDAPEKPLKKNVHLVDAAQYIASRYIPPPKIAPAASDQDWWTAEVYKSIRKNLKTRGATNGHDLGTISV
jgi:phage terminase large subunit